MPQSGTSGSVGAPGGNPRGDPIILDDVRRSVGEVLGGPAYAAGAAAMGARLREAARAQETIADLVGGLL
jgi:hypothetical protein